MITKYALVLVICSLDTNSCMPPFNYPIQFNDSYDCMMTGYKESLTKTEELGRDNINKHKIYIKFSCEPVQTI